MDTTTPRQSAEKRDYSAVDPGMCNPITLTIRVEIDAPETLTAPIAALFEALRNVMADGRNSAPMFEQERCRITAKAAPGAPGQPAENAENSSDGATLRGTETAVNCQEGQSGQAVDFPENSADAQGATAVPVNSPEGVEKDPAECPKAPAASDAALMEARQVQEEPEKQSSAITIMEVTRLITDIRNEFSELFTPERAKQFTEEIHKRSGVSYPPKTPEECVRMHTALMAMRRVLRFNRNKRNG